jgi:hypothetical protein
MAQAEIWRLLGNKGDRVPFKVANASAIAKGDFLELADPMTVTAHAGNVDTPIVGIAAHEKVANDGHLFITGITNCIFKATILAGGSCTIGDNVSMGNAAGEVNLSSSLDDEKGWAVGKAYEDGAAGHTAFFRSLFMR